MIRLLTLVLFSICYIQLAGQDLKITGVIDGPLSGGVPKAVELYATADIADLSIYGIGSANNGGGTDGEEFTFPNVAATAGQFIYVASQEAGFTSFFGFMPDYEDAAANINGDDAIELFMNGSVVDIYGDINQDGSGQPWEYLDGWAYRVDGTGPDGTSFAVANWTYSGPNALDGESNNAGAATPFPIGTFGGGSMGGVNNPTNFMATANGIDAIDLSWVKNGDDNDVLLAFSSTGAVTGSPDDGTSYTAGQTLSDGSTILYVGGDVAFNHTGLNENTTYFYSIWSNDGADTYSPGVAANATTESSMPIVASLLISGVLDGPLGGGTPKFIELYAFEDIADLSAYGVGSANNGGGSDGEEFTFPAGPLAKGSFIYLASESTQFENYMGFAPDYTNSAANINGDDAIELFLDGAVVDVFGDINLDGSGQPWEYQDGWAYRMDNTGPDGSTFVLANWIFSGPNALDGSTTNDGATPSFPVGSYGPDLVITGVIDGPLSGGVPKAVEFYALNDIADLSEYGFGSANNGGGTDGEEFTFPMISVSAGTFIYVASQSAGFNTYFGFMPDYEDGAANINGDDAIELFYQGTVLDVFGDINQDGSNQPWEYMDSWAYRNDDTGPDDSTFVLANWTFGGINSLDGSSANGVGADPFPIGTYNQEVVVNPELMTIAEARALPAGTSVTISGILTVSDQLGGPAYIQDTSGGVAVFDGTVHGDGLFSIGDSITLTGVRGAFNDQIQISPVTQLESHGPADNPIQPQVITLVEMGDHPGELVQINNASFPMPGDLLFENSNYLLTDGSGSGELRLDRDVEALVGKAQPDVCPEAVGVVGRFFETFQLLPRLEADLACAEEYMPPMPPFDLDQAATVDLVTWNIEWFGDEGNSPAAGNPMSDAIQKDSVKMVIEALQPDVMAVQEISDDALFAQLVSELSGYDFILSSAVSNPNDPGVKQKVGFIFKTETISVISSRPMLTSVHPLYNGNDASALGDYPTDPTRFFASGRMPFLMTADVTINGQTVQYDFVALHARANSSNDPQLRYDMRKYDVEALKDSLDASFADRNLVVMGDYNDDVDETVADIPSMISSYEDYTGDMINYDVLTDVLSEGGFRSFVFRENMIDHIAVTDELAPLYIDQTAQVHYEFYDIDYASTTSDHFPVSVKLQLSAFMIDTTFFMDASCMGDSDGSATIVVSGGVQPYEYEWSDGQMTATAQNLSAGTYTVVVTDQTSSTLEATFTIVEDGMAPVLICNKPNPFLCADFAPDAAFLIENGFVSAEDNCDDEPTIFSEGPQEVTFGCYTTQTFKFYAMDDAGNISDTCNLVVQFLMDDGDPVLETSNPDHLGCNPDSKPTPQDLIDGGFVTVTDGCGAAAIGVLPWVDTTVVDCDTILTYSFKATDFCNNQSEIKTVEVRWRVNTPIQLTCPEELIIECSDDDIDAQIASWLMDVTVEDVCNEEVLTNNYDPNGFTDLCASTREQVVTFTATDDCGESTSCMSTISIVDTTPPSIECPADITLNSDKFFCERKDVDLGVPTIMDDCDEPFTISIVRSDGMAIDAPYPVGITMVTWTVTGDCSGLSSTCVQKVKIVDSEPPTIVCAGKLFPALNDGEGRVIIPDSLFYFGVFDNCSADDFNYMITISQNEFSCLDGDTVSVEVCATDEAGNMGCCFVDVIPQDNTDPIAICQDVTVELVNGLAVITADTIDAGSFDNTDACGLSLSLSQSEFVEEGDFDVVLTVTDNAENMGTCDAVVTVRMPVQFGMKLWLQGPMNSANDAMRLTINAILPTKQPFDQSPWFYVGAEEVTVVPPNAVDWVLIDLRDKNDHTQILTRRAGFVLADGSVVDLDGVSDIQFFNTSDDDYFISAGNRNHLRVMTAAPIPLDGQGDVFVDYTLGDVFGGSEKMKMLITGAFALFSGDTNGDGSIDAMDRNNAWNDRNKIGYFVTDVNGDGKVDAIDRNIIWNNRNMISGF